MTASHAHTPSFLQSVFRLLFDHDVIESLRVQQLFDGGDAPLAQIVHLDDHLTNFGPIGLIDPGQHVHLATLDMRQNSVIHESVVAELLKVAGVEADYKALDEDARVDLLRIRMTPL